MNLVYLFFNAIQDLILYSMIGQYSPYVPQKWFKLDKYNNISHTIVFIIEGLTVNHYISNKSIFQHITSILVISDFIYYCVHLLLSLSLRVATFFGLHCGRRFFYIMHCG
jgi:hypothetical protein